MKFKNWLLNEEEQHNKVVQNAIDNTNFDYLQKSLTQRNPSKDSAGSTFDLPQTVENLKNANWEPLKVNPESIKSPAIAYQTPISGKLGITDINNLDDNLQAIIEPSHAGKGLDFNTGKLKAQLVTVLPEGYPKTEFTTIILGPKKEDPTQLQVWTFHPGPPVKSEIPIFLDDMKQYFNTESDKILTNISTAKKLGFKFVKHVNVLPHIDKPT